jgi:predicted Zn-dependent protease
MGNTISSTRSQAKTIQPSSLDQNLYKEKNKTYTKIKTTQLSNIDQHLEKTKTDLKVQTINANSLISSKSQFEKFSADIRIQYLNEDLKNTCHFDLLYQKARCLIVELDRFEEGLEECQNLLTRGEDCNVCILMAVAYLGLGQLENGERTVCNLRKMQLNKKQEGTVTLLEAEISFQKKEYPEALSLAEQARKQTDRLAAESIITRAKVYKAQNNEEQEYQCLDELRKVKIFDSVFVFKSLLRAGELHLKNKQIMKAGAYFFDILFSKTFSFTWTDRMHKEPLALFAMDIVKKKMQKGNHNEAGAYLWHILQILPDASWAYLLFLECMEHMNNSSTYPEEPAQIEQCLKEFPENPWLNLKIADLQVEEGKLDNTWTHYQFFLKKFPDSPFIFQARVGALIESLLMAYILGEVKFDKEVVRNCFEKLKSMPWKEPSRMKAGMYACTFILHGLEEKCQKKLSKEIYSLAETKEYTCFYYLDMLLATAFLRNDQFQESNHYFSIVIKYFINKGSLLTDVKDRPTDYIFCILAWIETSLYLKKLDHDFRLTLNNILKYNPKNAYAQFINGLLFFYDHNPKASIVALDEALALNSSTSFAGTAYYYKAIQQPEEQIALRSLLAKKALDLGCAKGVIPYSSCLVKGGKYKEAACLFEKHESTIEKNLTLALMDDLSVVFGKLGNFQKPIDLYLKAAKANPEIAELEEYKHILETLIVWQELWNFCENAEAKCSAIGISYPTTDSKDLQLLKKIEVMKEVITEMPGTRAAKGYRELCRGVNYLKNEITKLLEARMHQESKPRKGDSRTCMQKTPKKPAQQAEIETAIPGRKGKQRAREQKHISSYTEPQTAIHLPSNGPDLTLLEALERNKQKEERIVAEQSRTKEKRNRELAKDKVKDSDKTGNEELDQIQKELDQKIEQMPSREHDWFAEIEKKQKHPTSFPPLFIEDGHPHKFIENEAKKRCLEIMRKESRRLSPWENFDSKEYLKTLAEFRAGERNASDKCEFNDVLTAVPYKKEPLKSPSNVKRKKGILPAVLTERDLFIITSAKLACVSLKDTLNRKTQIEIFEGDNKITQMANSLLYNLLKLFDFLNDPSLEPDLENSLYKTFLDKDTINQARNALRHNFFALGKPRIFQLAQTLINGKAKERLDSLSNQQADFQDSLDNKVREFLPSMQEIINKTTKDYLTYLAASLDEFECLAEPFRTKYNLKILEQDSDSLHGLKMIVAKMCECLRQLRVEKQEIFALIIKRGNQVAHEKGDNPFDFEDIKTSDVWKLIEQFDAIKKAVSRLVIGSSR